MTFTKGQRVRYVGKHPTFRNLKRMGQLGTVQSCRALSVTVIFDNDPRKDPAGIYRENLEPATTTSHEVW